jgi:2',3'-cyclic-nucleotide 2'-phosphodiesterase (5'-nucleotidase family)
MRRVLAFLLILLSPAAGLWFVADSPVHVVIMHTNDLHGQLLPREGFGGIAEIATIIRAANPDLIVDAGDISTGTFLADEFKGAPTIRAMNQIGYMVGTIGNHEFDYGQDALRLRLREAKFPVLSANLRTSISQIKKYAIVTAKGVRFGFIGLTTEDVKTQSHPKNVVGVTVLDTVKTLEQLLPEVRKKSDFIIVLAHVEDAEEKRIASAFPEIQLIIGGHNHQALGPFRLDKTLVVKTGSAGRRVGRVDLDFQDKKLTQIEASLIPVTDVRPDPTIAKTLRPFSERVQAKMTEVIGDATDDLTSSRTAESPLANVLADAFREKTKTQIAIHNVGGIRTSIPKGKVTWGKAFEVLPFQNTLVTLNLTGAQLKKTLERGLAPTVGMVAVSGIRVQFNGNASQTEPTVSALLSDGTPIDDSKVYSVTTNDFVLAGGDGFTEFGKGTDIQDTGIYLRDVLVEYIKTHRSISPNLDGRIVVKGK